MSSILPKIYLSQNNYIVGDIEGNSQIIINEIKIAIASHCDAIVFAELAICGYPPEDLLDYPHFVQECVNAMDDIALHCQNITAIVGGISFNNEKGRGLYNSAYVLSNSKVDKIIYKTLLPTYDVFTESRYFEPSAQLVTEQIVNIKGLKCHISICEDLWDNDNDFEYKISPIKNAADLKPDLLINIAASPYHYKKHFTRQNILKRACIIANAPLIYLNQVGAQTNLIFDGASLFLDKNGDIINELKFCEIDNGIIDLNLEHNIQVQKETDIEQLYEAIILGVKDYFFKSGFKTALLGSSGGIDSAIVQALLSDALGAENVLAVLMPSEFSSGGSVLDAEELSENLGNPTLKLPIKNLYDSYMETLQPAFKDTNFGVAEENLQARSRAVLLMALSNKFGRILVNTSNKSEMAVGYTTLYGDMCGAFGPIADLYKTTVYELVNFINKDKIRIPLAIINKPPSAELRPDQKDSDTLPNYDVLDRILLEYIENQQCEESIIKMGFEKQLVQKIIKMVNRNEYKRFQAPPVLRVSTKAFGSNRRMPLVGRI